MTDPPPAPPPPESRKDRYLRLLRLYDAQAVKYKWRRTAVWATGLFATWLPLALAVAGLAGKLTAWFGPAADGVTLHTVIPAAHALAAAVVVVQMFVSIRGWWLKSRAAAERLRDHGMRFRARAAPYHRADAEAEFDQFLGKMETAMADTRPDPARRRLWVAVETLAGGNRHPSPPDEGLTPRVGDAGRSAAADRELIFSRLRNQQAWHLRKAGYYYRRYVGYQVLLTATYLASWVYVRVVGHEFGVVALTASVGLILLGVREFMEYGPLSIRYNQLAYALGELEADYQKNLNEVGGDRPATDALLAKLTVAVEAKLASEFRAWHLVLDTVSTDS